MARKKAVAFDETLRALRAYLDRYEVTRPGSKTTAYRRNSASFRARIVDPGFQGLNRVERDEYVWKTMSRLPDEVHQELTVLLLLTEELSTSFANMDFDHPIPSPL